LQIIIYVNFLIIMLVYALTLLGASVASAKQDSAVPEQMHLAIGGPNEFVAAWYTKDEKASSTCVYGLSPDDMSMSSTAGKSVTYLEDWGTHHRATMTDLLPESTYYYQCGDAEKGMSKTFSFKTLPKEGNSAPLRFGILGDMGWLDSVQRPMRKLGDITMEGNWSAVFSRNLMEQWKDNGEVDMFYHVGDVGYADDAVFHSLATAVQFEYEDAYNGYMNWIENVTATMPYHVCPGNHESECHDPRCIIQFKKYGKPLSNFTAYNSRWVMPSESSGGVASMWFSWDHGPVHFTSIDTSTDFEGAPEGEKGDSGIFAAGHFAPDGAYLAWVEAI
jgi:acid phosphatase type 7